MQSGDRRRVTAGLVPLVALPGVVGTQSLDPSVVVDTPGLQAASAFLLVVLFGGAVLHRYEGSVDRSIDAMTDQPLAAVVYGVMAHIMIAFAGFGFLTQVARVGGGGRMVYAVGTTILAVVLLALGGLGFLVVGTWLTDLRGERRPWNGLLVGAAIGSLGLLVLPPPGGFVAWVLLVSAGIGGLTRTWVHDERAHEADPGG